MARAFWETKAVRRLTHIVVLAAFTFSCGGHWCVFQAIGWANMIREYSQMVPLGEAMSMTFSGQYPCPICKAIANKKSSDQQKSLGLEKYDKKYLPVASIDVPSGTETDFEYLSLRLSWSFHNDRPPTPPPRLALS